MLRDRVAASWSRRRESIVKMRQARGNGGGYMVVQMQPTKPTREVKSVDRQGLVLESISHILGGRFV